MRTVRSLVNGASALGAIVFFGLFAAQWTMFLTGGGWTNIGPDYDIYMEATTRWLAGHGFYLPHQVAGPYVVEHGDVLYPPTFLLLLLPFQVLPAVTWYAIPLAVTTAAVLFWRPSAPAWLAIAVCLWFPITGVKMIHGNPGLWIMAAIALGTRWPWASPLVLLKPTAAPFAIPGIGRRGWWLSLAGLAALSLLFLPMWGDYVRVLLNAVSDGGVLYSLNEFPMLAIPLFAWIGRRGDPAGA